MRLYQLRHTQSMTQLDMASDKELVAVLAELDRRMASDHFSEEEQDLIRRVRENTHRKLEERMATQIRYSSGPMTTTQASSHEGWKAGTTPWRTASGKVQNQTIAIQAAERTAWQKGEEQGFSPHPVKPKKSLLAKVRDYFYDEIEEETVTGLEGTDAEAEGKVEEPTASEQPATESDSVSTPED